MNEWLVLGGIVLAAASGIPAALPGRGREKLCFALLAASGALAGAGAVGALLAPSSSGLRFAWSVSGGELHVRVDALSSMFLLLLCLLSLCGAAHGLGYWRDEDHPRAGPRLRLFWGSLTAGIALLTIAGSSIVFLLGWEVMALSAFLALVCDDRDPAVREAGLVYLFATHFGTLCLFLCFALLEQMTGTLTLQAFDATLRPSLAGAVFLTALAGFGMKAGLAPLHLWLPGAHAAAPSNLSAFLSGMLLKAGVFGLVRITSLADGAPSWWGYLTLALGGVSAVVGVAFAIGQHDLKRLLAYHSVENVGIIFLGIGAALVGRAMGDARLMALGLAGGLLHVWNHGMFKALLFLSAGAVVHATGTREIDALGGLYRRMPWSGSAFLLGAVAISGLPPLNGFVSELLVYLSLLALALGPAPAWIAGAVMFPALAMVGALAVACFAKAFGAVFLGQPRTTAAASAHPAPWSMRVPMLLLMSLCAAVGVAPLLVAPVLDRVRDAWAPELPAESIARLAPLRSVSFIAVVLLASGGLGALAMLRARHAGRTVTWDCGYAAPTARMQYTSSSFAQVLVHGMRGVLRPYGVHPRLGEAFPARAGFHSHVPEVVLDLLVAPAFRGMGSLFQLVRWLQGGSLPLYLSGVALTALLLLVLAR